MGPGECPGADCSICVVLGKSCDGSFCVSGGSGNSVMTCDMILSQLV